MTLNAIAPLIVAWLANSERTNLTLMSPDASLTATVLTVLAVALLNPSNRSAFKLVTTVVDATVKGAVPVATVEFKVLANTAPLTPAPPVTNNVPVAVVVLAMPAPNVTCPLAVISILFKGVALAPIFSKVSDSAVV